MFAFSHGQKTFWCYALENMLMALVLVQSNNKCSWGSFSEDFDAWLFD